MHGAAARLAAQLRSAMKDQALSGRELAARVERLTGKPFPEQYVSRRLAPTADRPLITIPEHLRYFAQVLGLDLGKLVKDAIDNEDRCPTCGSPNRAERWTVSVLLCNQFGDVGHDCIDHGYSDPAPCDREFHLNATCAKKIEGQGVCALPIEYVSEGTDETSGWYHTDRSTTGHHHAIPPSTTR